MQPRGGSAIGLPTAPRDLLTFANSTRALNSELNSSQGLYIGKNQGRGCGRRAARLLCVSINGQRDRAQTSTHVRKPHVRKPYLVGGALQESAGNDRKQRRDRRIPHLISQSLRPKETKRSKNFATLSAHSRVLGVISKFWTSKKLLRSPHPFQGLCRTVGREHVSSGEWADL